MARVHVLGPALWSLGTARPVRPEAQALLEVPVSYGGRGAWIDRRSWPQLHRLLEHCRDDLALYGGTTPARGATRPLAMADPVVGDAAVAERRRRFLAGLFDAEGELCAAVEVRRREPDDGEWWLGLILVRPDLRGRGIGSSVVEALEAWVRAEGGRAIFVAVQRRNAAALHFARRTGFVFHADAASAGRVELLVRRVA